MFDMFDFATTTLIVSLIKGFVLLPVFLFLFFGLGRFISFGNWKIKSIRFAFGKWTYSLQTGRLIGAAVLFTASIFLLLLSYQMVSEGRLNTDFGIEPLEFLPHAVPFAFLTIPLIAVWTWATWRGTPEKGYIMVVREDGSWVGKIFRPGNTFRIDSWFWERSKHWILFHETDSETVTYQISDLDKGKVFELSRTFRMAPEVFSGDLEEFDFEAALAFATRDMYCKALQTLGYGCPEKECSCYEPKNGPLTVWVDELDIKEL
jgi:hypothetical protein